MLTGPEASRPKQNYPVCSHVIADQPAEMLFIQRDDMVKDLAPETPHPALRDAILPGAPGYWSAWVSDPSPSKKPTRRYAFGVLDRIALFAADAEENRNVISSARARRTGQKVRFDEPRMHANQRE